jgi:hypothetical protein
LVCAGCQPAEVETDRYTPTKLEWLVLQLNVDNPASPNANNSSRTGVRFKAEAPDTVAVTYSFKSKSKTPEEIAGVEKAYTHEVEQAAGKHGWKFRVRFEPTELP